MAASIKDVALKAGVSIATVSHVLNNSVSVSEANKSGKVPGYVVADSL